MLKITPENSQNYLIAGMIGGVIYAIMLIISLANILGSNQPSSNPTAALIHVGISVPLIVIGIYGLWKRWRSAGILLFAILFVNIVAVYIKTGQINGILWIIILTFLFLQCCRVCFQHHRFNIEKNIS